MDYERDPDWNPEFPLFGWNEETQMYEETGSFLLFGEPPQEKPDWRQLGF